MAMDFNVAIIIKESASSLHGGQTVWNNIKKNIEIILHAVHACMT